MYSAVFLRREIARLERDLSRHAELFSTLHLKARIAELEAELKAIADKPPVNCLQCQDVRVEYVAGDSHKAIYCAGGNWHFPAGPYSVRPKAKLFRPPDWCPRKASANV